MALANRNGDSPFKDAKGFGDGLVRGEDALLSFGANGRAVQLDPRLTPG